MQHLHCIKLQSSCVIIIYNLTVLLVFSLLQEKFRTISSKLWIKFEQHIFSAYLLVMITFAVFNFFLQLIQFLSMLNYPTLFHSLSLNQRHKFSLLHWYICLFLYTMFVLLHSMKSINPNIYLKNMHFWSPYYSQSTVSSRHSICCCHLNIFCPPCEKKIKYLGGKIKYFDFIY